MKSPLCIVLCLCSTFMACKGENPITSTRRDRPVEARLSGAEHRPYKQPAGFRMSCKDAVADSRETALSLLAEAGGDCLDRAVREVERHAKEDLAAAYLTRFERQHDPLDLLRALETAKGFNRALALERLYLTKEAIHSWNGIVQEHSDWSEEAWQHVQRLQTNPVQKWDVDALVRAVQGRDRGALTRMARAFPADAARQFERLDLRDREGARLLANALAAAGEHYPQAVVDAMDRTRDRAALEQGLAALHDRKYQRAVMFLERAGNPLSLVARYYVAASGRSRPVLDATIPHLKPEYRELSSRIHAYRANLLEFEDRYLEAHADYKKALAFAKGEPTSTAAALGRRSLNFAEIGDAETAFRDAHDAMSFLHYVADTDTRNHAYGSAARAARRLGYPQFALYYQTAAVESVQRAVINARSDTLREEKLELAVALRARAEIHLELGQHADAEGDLAQAADLAEAADLAPFRDLLQMRIRDVQGQVLLKTRPAEAVVSFSEAIDRAKELDSTYRAIVYFQRAAARRAAGDPRAADDDIAEALHILRDEVRHALASDPQAASEPLWTPYFSRFRDQYYKLIESRIDANDKEGAFVQDELALAFEPMQILLQSGSVPPGYRPIETAADLPQARANLPADTVILQFLVLPDRTFTWVVTREGIELVQQRTTKKKIETWVADAVASIKGGQSDPLTRVLRAAYGELFREPLAFVPKSKTRIVIVPDEPMQGLPFNALQGGRDEGYLIERGSVSVAGSTSLYLYALARDRQLSRDRNPTALLIGDPAFDSRPFAFPELRYARQEVEELSLHDYSNAEVLTGADATVQRFLTAAKSATIIHFAGHALANPQNPWQSRLLFAPGPQGQSGELTAQTLMQQLPRLGRARLVVLGACSTAGGSSVGPQGLAPLVRPLIAANVPAVVGTLWDVKDASAKELLVSFHCHYRHGDDVAVALRQAQLERLRKHDPANKWAAFQVVGYAASPYAPIAMEDPNNEHLCTQNSFQRPNGLHPQ